MSDLEARPHAVELDSAADSFVGSYFHADVKRQWQGVVLEQIEPGYYYVLTFSWLDGRDHTRHVVPIAEMADWRFYETDEGMRDESQWVRALWDRERGDQS